MVPSMAGRAEACVVSSMSLLRAPAYVFSMPLLRALILDLGGVLVHTQPDAEVDRMADVARVPVAAFTKAYWAHRPSIDRIGDVPAYWDAVLQDAGSPLDGPARAAARTRLGQLDGESWSRLREEVWEITAGFRAAGGRTAILSNCGPEVIGHIRAKRRLEEWFDVAIISWELRLLKPEPAIYHAALERLGVEPGAALFADDSPVNVAAAQALGMEGLLFSGDESVPALRERVLARSR